MNKKPKLLITGANGFTGRHACSHFAKSGFDITAVTRNITFDDQFKIEHCDLTDKLSVGRLVKKIKPEYLIHLAGQNHVGQSWNDPASSIETNTMSTLYIIEAIRKECPDCKIIVTGSALQFDPQDISTLTHPYSLSKTLQVLIAQSWGTLYNLHIVIAKPSNLIGPGLSNGVCSIFAKKIINMEENKLEKVLEVNNLNSKRDFIDVRDAVRAYEVLLTNGQPGETYEISSGKAHSLNDVVEGFRTLSKMNFEIKSNVNEEKEEEGRAIKPIKMMKLGWEPIFSFEKSLEDILHFYRR